MALIGVVLELTIAVVTMLVVATLIIVGPQRFGAAARDFRWRLEACVLPLTVLAAVLFLRWATGDILPRLSWIFGSNITPYIEIAERAVFGVNPVIFLQSYQSPELTSFFVFIYLHGYAFLLLFPFIAYFALDRMNWLSSLILAFTANYAIGLVCYVLFIAYGPRNLIALEVEHLLYTAYPQSRYLTNAVNQNTNVFPSLHTSLAMTVFFLAWLTRDKYPLWVPISGFIAISVVISTMYLGIHWLSDVIAGTVLAAISVYIGVNYSVDGLFKSARLFVGDRFQRGEKPDS